MVKRQATLGAVVRSIRNRNGWTLKQMSDKCEIPVSTLTKVEHDRLTLTYDKLQQLSQRLGLRMSDLFAEDEPDTIERSMTRRSIGSIDSAFHINGQNYEEYYLCKDLRSKKMIPMFSRIKAKTIEEFGDLVRHKGEEFVYVIKGSIIVHTEHYSPARVDVGQFLYIDSTMGHAYLLADDCEEAVTMVVMSGGEDTL